MNFIVGIITILGGILLIKETLDERESSHSTIRMLSASLMIILIGVLILLGKWQLY